MSTRVQAINIACGELYRAVTEVLATVARDEYFGRPANSTERKMHEQREWLIKTNLDLARHALEKIEGATRA